MQEEEATGSNIETGQRKQRTQLGWGHSRLLNSNTIELLRLKGGRKSLKCKNKITTVPAGPDTEENSLLVGTQAGMRSSDAAREMKYVKG